MVDSQYLQDTMHTESILVRENLIYTMYMIKPIEQVSYVL